MVYIITRWQNSLTRNPVIVASFEKMPRSADCALLSRSSVSATVEISSLHVRDQNAQHWITLLGLTPRRDQKSCPKEPKRVLYLSPGRFHTIVLNLHLRHHIPLSPSSSLHNELTSAPCRASVDDVGLFYLLQPTRTNHAKRDQKRCAFPWLRIHSRVCMMGSLPRCL